MVSRLLRGALRSLSFGRGSWNFSDGCCSVQHSTRQSGNFYYRDCLSARRNIFVFNFCAGRHYAGAPLVLDLRNHLNFYRNDKLLFFARDNSALNFLAQTSNKSRVRTGSVSHKNSLTLPVLINVPAMSVKVWLAAPHHNPINADKRA